MNNMSWYEKKDRHTYMHTHTMMNTLKMYYSLIMHLADNLFYINVHVTWERGHPSRADHIVQQYFLTLHWGYCYSCHCPKKDKETFLVSKILLQLVYTLWKGFAPSKTRICLSSIIVYNINGMNILPKNARNIFT